MPIDTPDCRVEVEKNITDHVTNYYKEYIYHCRCNNCGQTWTFRRKGGLLARHIDRKIKKKETTYTPIR